MAKRALAPRVDGAVAAHRLERRWSLLSKRSVSHLELLWMPFYLVTLDLGQGERRRALRVLVDGRGGAAMRLLGEVAWGEAPRHFGAPLLSETEALSSAHALLRRRLLLQRGRRGAALEIVDRSVELVAYPFWMVIFERRRRRYDIRLLDAVGGRRAGSETRRSVLAALVEESRLTAGVSRPELGEAAP